MSKEPTVVIVGRMNVGKSTLFNRLSHQVKSITLNYAGVTRDIIKDFVEWNNVRFNLIDTGGIALGKTTDPLLEQVRQKALAAIENADIALLVVDGTIGVMNEDLEISRLLHKMRKKTFLVVNKTDSQETQQHIYEFEKLNHELIIPLSAQHGIGINELLDHIIRALPKKISTQSENQPSYRVVLLGRPNVGKSSLMNALVKQERSIVSEIPGTTREAVTERIEFYKESVELTDTPGIRRKRAISGQLEPMMVKSSLEALKNADIVVLIIDVTHAELADQELKLAFYAFAEQYKGLLLLLNKVDLMTDRMKETLDCSLDYYKHLIKKIPVMQISCLTGKNIGRVLPLIKSVWENYSQRLPDEEINRLFIGSLSKKPLLHKTQYLQVVQVRQLSTAPITIGMEVNEPEWFGPSQLGFFENLLREKYDLSGVPVKFIVRKKL